MRAAESDHNWIYLELSYIETNISAIRLDYIFHLFLYSSWEMNIANLNIVGVSQVSYLYLSLFDSHINLQFIYVLSICY